MAMMGMVMTVVVVTAVTVVMMVMTAAAVIMGGMMVGMDILRFPNDHFPLHRPGQTLKLRDQGIRVLRCQPQLPGGEGNGGLLHLGKPVEFGFDLGRAVGAVQILHNIYFTDHGNPSVSIKHMSIRSFVNISIRFPVSFVNTVRQHFPAF